MHCPECGSPLEEKMQFCPECGRSLADAVQAEPAADPDPVPQQPDAAGDAEDDCGMSELTQRLRQMEASYSEPIVADDPFAPDAPADGGAIGDGYDPQSAPQGEQAAATQIFTPLVQESFGDGYTQEDSQPSFRYARTTVGKRIASILLCILTAAMLLFTICDGALRLALSEETVLRATEKEELLQSDLLTSEGRMPAAQVLLRRIGEETVTAYSVTQAKMTEYLKDSPISDAARSLMLDCVRVLMQGKEPEYLNAGYIVSVLREINTTLSAAVGDDVAVFDVADVTARMQGGDLSYLNLTGEGFIKRYGVSWQFTSALTSVFGLLICGGIVILFLVMIFVINSANAPAGLSFSGTVMIVAGGLLAPAAGAMAILSLIRRVWILTPLMRQFALWLGVISGSVLLVGIVFTVIARILRKRARIIREQD